MYGVLLWYRENFKFRGINVTTGGPSSSCDMIILHNNSHGGIIRVCMRIFTTALRNKTIRQILNKNTSPYFHSVSLVIWPFTLMKRTHFSELSISRFSTYIRTEPKAEHSISERPIREAKNPSAKWPGGHKSDAESKYIYCSFISIQYKLNLTLASDAKPQFASKISNL